jgi:hypothetical protein
MMIKRFLPLIALAIASASFAADKPLVMESGQIKQLPSATSLQLQAPTTANASINLPHGTAPTSPTNGDCWTTTGGFYCRINGSTVGPYSTGSGSGSVTSIATSGLVTGGTITSTGTISLSNIGSGDVVGNSGASSAAPADTTLTAIIDRAIGGTQGQILYRGSSTWSALSPGTAGQVLQTGGSGANPGWATPAGSGGGGGGAYSVPAVGTFAWVNQSTSTADQLTSTGPILMTTPSTGLNWRILKIAIPSTPYRVRALLRGMSTSEAPSAAWAKGLYFYDGTKLAGIEACVGCAGTAVGQTRVEKITNVTTDSSTVTSNNYYGSAQVRNEVFWAQIRDDGTTLYFDTSLDGDNWINLTSFSRASFITPTHIGWGGVSNNNGIFVSLLAWTVDSTASLN